MEQGASMLRIYSHIINENMVKKSPKKPYILLVDDDPIFGKILQREARQRGAELAFVCSYKDFRKVNLNLFDVLVVDYFLDSATRGTALAKECGDKPVILVSRSQSWLETEGKASPVKHFVHKKLGPDGIMALALEILGKVEKGPTGNSQGRVPGGSPKLSA